MSKENKMVLKVGVGLPILLGLSQVLLVELFMLYGG